MTDFEITRPSGFVVNFFGQFEILFWSGNQLILQELHSKLPLVFIKIKAYKNNDGFVCQVHWT